MIGPVIKSALPVALQNEDNLSLLHALQLDSIHPHWLFYSGKYKNQQKKLSCKYCWDNFVSENKLFLFFFFLFHTVLSSLFTRRILRAISLEHFVSSYFIIILRSPYLHTGLPTYLKTKKGASRTRQPLRHFPITFTVSVTVALYTLYQGFNEGSRISIIHETKRERKGDLEWQTAAAVGWQTGVATRRPNSDYRKRRDVLPSARGRSAEGISPAGALPEGALGRQRLASSVNWTQ